VPFRKAFFLCNSRAYVRHNLIFASNTFCVFWNNYWTGLKTIACNTLAYFFRGTGKKEEIPEALYLVDKSPQTD